MILHLCRRRNLFCTFHGTLLPFGRGKRREFPRTSQEPTERTGDRRNGKLVLLFRRNHPRHPGGITHFKPGEFPQPLDPAPQKIRAQPSPDLCANFEPQKLPGRSGRSPFAPHECHHDYPAHPNQSPGGRLGHDAKGKLLCSCVIKHEAQGRTAVIRNKSHTINCRG